MCTITFRAMSASRGTAAEANDVAVRIFDTEVLRTPSGRGERSQDRDPAGSALRVERFDASDPCRRIEMLVLAPVPALGFILGRLFQMQFQSVDTADGVEVVPRLVERETEPPVVGHRALEVVDEELRGERCHTRLHGDCHRGAPYPTDMSVATPKQCEYPSSSVTKNSVWP